MALDRFLHVGAALALAQSESQALRYVPERSPRETRLDKRLAKDPKMAWPDDMDVGTV